MRVDSWIFRTYHGGTETLRTAQIKKGHFRFPLATSSELSNLQYTFWFSPCLRGRCYVSVEVARRDGSSSCLCGPLPLNHNDPPCSRNVVGATGSAPRVISSDFFPPCFALSAASTRSGVNGASRSRTPTAS